jgi:ATP-dependent RNA circularization protein (DNA/RNA ligase family)
LVWLGEKGPRDDKVLDPLEAEEFLRGPIVVEEKVDGANIGIAFDQSGSPVVWNRGTLLNGRTQPQFEPLWSWLGMHRQNLASSLEERLILFGEWCFAVHSVQYDCLPDWFLAFDVYEITAGRFWSSERRNTLVRSLGLSSVPALGSGNYNLAQLKSLLKSTQSQWGNTQIEGLYLRSEMDGWLVKRAKLVRPEFAQAIDEHWTSHPLIRNALSESRPRSVVC